MISKHRKTPLNLKLEDGVVLKLPSLSAEEFSRVQDMLDNPDTYSKGDFHTVLKEVLKYLMKAEAFALNVHLHLDQCKKLWSKWLSALKE